MYDRKVILFCINGGLLFVSHNVERQSAVGDPVYPRRHFIVNLPISGRPPPALLNRCQRKPAALEIALARQFMLWTLLCLLLLISASALADRYQGWEIDGFDLRLDPSLDLTDDERVAAENLMGEAYSGLALAGKRGILGRRHPDFQSKALESDRSRLALLMARGGFPQASSRPEFELDREARRLHLLLIVDPGPMYRIGAVHLEGLPDDPPLALEADSLCALHADGRQYSDAEAELIGENLMEIFRERGYARVELESSTLRSESNIVSLSFRLSAGRRYRFIGLNIEGVEPDLSALAERHLAFTDGAEYSPELLKRAQLELRELGLFRRIDLRVEPVGDGLLRLTGALSPRKAISTRVSLGTWSDHLWRIKASWRHRNLFHRGRGFSARGAWSATQREIDLSAWWLGLPRPRARASLSLSFVAEREASYSQDTAEIGLGVLLRPWRPWQEQWSLNIGLARVEVEHPNGGIDHFELGTGELLTIGLGFLSDGSDDPFFPRSGFRFRAAAEISPSGPLSDYPFAAFECQASGYRSLANAVAALRLGIGVAEPLGDSERLLPAKHLFAGGGSSMRGYRRRELGPVDAEGDPLGGRSRFLASAELRLPAYGKLGAVIFCDAGQVWARQSDVVLGDLAVAIGPGLSIATPIGPVRGDFAFNLKDATDDWVFHLSIGNPW